MQIHLDPCTYSICNRFQGVVLATKAYLVKVTCPWSHFISFAPTPQVMLFKGSASLQFSE